MTDSHSINIKISTTELQDFCNLILKRSRDITKTHDALITLESFISIFARPAHGTVEYAAIEASIKEITEASRKRLLEKYTQELINSLKRCNISGLTLVHTPLSRNGFYQILQQAIQQLSDDDIRLVMLWSENWLNEAKERGQKASGYPDAMNFKKAGISIEEFQAMSDIDRVLNS